MIIERMYFSNFCDFYDRRKMIKHTYMALPLYERQLYKHYVYSRRYLKEKICDYMWEFLNATDDTECMIAASNLGKEYSKYLYVQRSQETN